MKIIVAHNYYQQRGGECLSFEANASLLEDRGHEVHRFTLNNDDIDQQSRVKVAVQTIWNASTRRKLASMVQEVRPAIVHFTNTFPKISPSVYSVARHLGAAVIQDLRNYRLVCAAFNFLRDGKICEDCLGRSIAVPAIRHRCYRGSLPGSVVVASMQAVHHALGTWRSQIDLFMTPSEFAKSKYVQAGFERHRIRAKPNFIDSVPEVGEGNGDYAIFIGRLSPEKGVELLLDAWQKLRSPLKLLFVGDGEQNEIVASAARLDPRIQAVGWKSHDELLELIGDARLLIMPSLWYETFGRTIIEAYAKGCPVIASRLGSMQELVLEGVTGFCFEAGNSDDLVRAVQKICSQSEEERAAMRCAAHDEFLKRYTANENYKMLMEAYQSALYFRGNGHGQVAPPVRRAEVERC